MKKIMLMLIVAGMLFGTVGCKQSKPEAMEPPLTKHTPEEIRRAEKQIDASKAGDAKKRIQDSKEEPNYAGEKMTKAEQDEARKQKQVREAEKRATKQSSTTKMDRQANDLLTTGVVYSINIDFNEARVNTSLWLQMTLNQKQSLVLFFSAYFDAKGSTGRVTILSSRNDTKLASYGSWGGLKIIY